MDNTKVTVAGMGYAGLALALTLARKGLAGAAAPAKPFSKAWQVFGFDRDTQIVGTLNNGIPHIYEPGVEELLKKHLNKNLFISATFPADPQDVVIVCVPTPVDERKQPDLSNLKDVVTTISEKMDDRTLVVIRSTVPVGTSRNVVLPILQKRRQDVRLAFCPERAIQGRVIQELEILPQIVGGLDETSAAMASAFFIKMTEKVVIVSSLECAELVKLANNCHTDLLYSYGNELALMAEKFALDPLEVIDAANFDYPRPDIAMPGFVGGSCLSKDPYLLMDSLKQFDHSSLWKRLSLFFSLKPFSKRLESFFPKSLEPSLVRNARRLNESLPFYVVRKFWERLTQLKDEVNKILICGFAFKGWPVTDDVRGSAVAPILSFMRERSVDLYGHDYVVKPDVIESFGVTYATIQDGFRDADAVIFVNNHPEYRNIDIRSLIETMRKPALIFDCWRIFKDRKLGEIDGVHYGGIGYG